MAFAIQVVIPLAAALMLLALGLTLDLAQILRLAEQPRALVLGLLVRWILGPAIAVGVCLLVHPPGPTALGLVLVGCCPLGTPVPAVVRAARGDVALGLALTAATNLASPVLLPLLLAAGSLVLGLEQSVRPGALGSTALRIAAVVMVPTVLGMAMRRSWPGFARAIEPKVTPFALVMIAAIVAGLLLTSREHVVASLVQSGAIALTMNVLALGVAMLLGRVARVAPAEQVAVVLAAGLFNFGLHAFVSLTLLRDARVLLPAVAYGILMWVTATGVAVRARRRGSGEPEVLASRTGQAAG